MRIRRIAERSAATLFIVVLWLWAGAKMMMDWIGRSTFADDFENAQGILVRGADWLFSTPWWAPAALATVLTIFLIFYLIPREEHRRASDGGAVSALDRVTAWQTSAPPAVDSGKYTDALSVDTLVNLDRFINEFFIPSHEILENAFGKIGKSRDLSITVMLLIVLARDRELIASAITKARYSQPLISNIMDNLDIAFDHYMLALLSVRESQSEFSLAEQTQFNELMDSARKLFYGVRWLVGSTPSCDGIGKIWRTTGKDIDFRVLIADTQPSS